MPLSVTCSQCGKTYTLKDEFAGKKIRCPQCDNVQVVPIEEVIYVSAEPVDEEGGERVALHPSFQRDKFLMRQKMMAISAKYVVSDEAKRPILYIERPAHLMRQIGAAFGAVAVFFLLAILTVAVAAGLREATGLDWVAGVAAILGGLATLVLTIVAAVRFSPKRHIHFYADETKQEPLLDVLQDRKFEVFSTTFTVQRPDTKVLARIRKNQLTNILRKKWVVSDAEGRPLFIAREDSLILSLIRRLIPALQFMRTNFIFVMKTPDGNEQVRGEFNRKFTIVDSYVLDLARDRPPLIDRRIGIALGVLLDTGERR
ncbi:hypothetical protein [Paludisphaera mucosa]|uniref:Zinc finger/thioredoxin putative domain-containing protein n=1 Tax=Paludisphaera mucosa TaxID=3030827 RepID=A0ABT6F5N5_9BACT|nr:hypothetical protein [Paludisphaera mucosa]MDG3002892.1 hypothetical protein [Paludisphaera mucosa]